MMKHDSEVWTPHFTTGLTEPNSERCNNLLFFLILNSIKSNSPILLEMRTFIDDETI